MKALAERILKHPLKVIKCFHMPKLLAVEKKKIIFLNIPGGNFSPICMEMKSSDVDQCL